MDKDRFPVIERSSPACPGRIDIPTEKERQALVAMRSIKKRVRQLKGDLAEQKTLDGDEHTEKAQEMREELTRLKKDWDRWEEKRKQAAKERMILLGHERGS